MPRNPTTGVFTRVSNSFSDPVFGTVIDPVDADALFDDYDTGLTFNDASPLELVGSTSGVLTILAPDTASGTLTLPAGTTDFSATGGASNVVKQTSVGGPFTVAQLTPADISGAASSSTINAAVRFSDTTGGTKNSVVIIGDTGNLSGVGNVNASGNIITSKAASGALQLTGATSGIEHGDKSSSNSPFYDWNSSGFNNDFDLRMQVSGGVSGVSGTGSMAFTGTLAIAPTYNATLNPYQQGLTIIHQSKGNAPQGPVLIDGWSANEIIFTDSGINSEAFPVGSQTTNALHVHYEGNGNKGIGQAVLGTFAVSTAPTTTDPNLNQFVAGQFIGQVSVNLGGTNTSSGARGGVFGVGATALAASGATNLLNVSNEFNAALKTGSSSRYFSVISSVTHSTHAVSGAESDCSISISSMGAGVNSGIEFSDLNGAHPVKTTGTLIKTRNSATVANGIDFSSYTISGDFLKSATFVVSGAGAVTTGTWSGTAITAAKGGTGQTTYTKGDLLVTPGGTTINKLAVGTDGYVLTADAASTNGVKWAVLPASGITALTGDVTASGTGSVAATLATAQPATHTWSVNGALSTPAALYSGTWITGGTATTNKPHVLIEPSGATSTGWSTAGTGLGINAATGFTGYYLDAQLNGVRQFGVTVSGGYATINTNALPLMFAAQSVSNLMQIGSFGVGPGGGGSSFALGTSTVTFTGLWLGTNTTGTAAVGLFSDAANTMAQRNGTNAQVKNLYDTYTSSTDYHRLAMKTARATLSGVSGASVTATGIIPDGAVVVGVTTKVTTGLGTGGGTTGYQVGDGSDTDRWGTVTGTIAGTSTDNRDWTATTIQAFTAASDIVITANGGNFNGTGVIYVSVQYLIGECD